MHIKPYDNHNEPIVGANDARVPLVYMNIVKLKQGETFTYAAEGYETCCVPAHGTIDVSVGNQACALRGSERVRCDPLNLAFDL